MIRRLMGNAVIADDKPVIENEPHPPNIDDGVGFFCVSVDRKRFALPTMPARVASPAFCSFDGHPICTRALR